MAPWSNLLWVFLIPISLHAKGRCRSGVICFLGPESQGERILVRIFFLSAKAWLVILYMSQVWQNQHLRQLPRNVILRAQSFPPFLQASKVTWGHHTRTVAG